jgi:hypothetical protein
VTSFNITPSDKALLPWAAFALLLAYTCELRLLLVAGLICVTGFIAARVGAWSGHVLAVASASGRSISFRPRCAMFMLPAVRQPAPPGRLRRDLAADRHCSPLPADAGAGQLGPRQLSAVRCRRSVEGFYQVAGFVAGALLAWLGARRGWPEVMNTAVVFFVIFLYTKLFDWWWAVMPKFLFFLVLGLVALLVIFVLKRLRTAMLHTESAS